MMQANERDTQIAIDSLIHRIKELQQSIFALLNKLEMNEKLEWPMMLENFAVLSSQFTSLVQILQNSRTPNLRNLALLPVRLSLDLDPNLQKTTENRVLAWSHAVVPDYLRTKLEDRLVEGSREVLTNQQATSSRVSSTNQEALQKIVNQMNKACANAFDVLTAASKEELDVEGAKLNETCLQKDTEQLILGVSMGIGFKPSAMGVTQSQMPGKYGPNVKSGMKSIPPNVTQQPYPR